MIKTILTLILNTSILALAKNYVVIHSEEVRPFIHQVVKPARATSFVLKKEDRSYIITNWHVCNSSDNGSLLISINNNVNPKKVIVIKATIIKQDPNSDLCALTAPSLKGGLVLAETQKFNTVTYIIGYPRGIPYQILTSGFILPGLINPSLDYGAVQKCPWALTNNKCMGSIKLYDTSIPASPGNSGSPALNINNEIVGVLQSTNGDRGAIIPLNTLKNFIVSL